jgi:hypothetical protein
MIGSRYAAEAANGRTIAQRRGRPGRFLFMSLALALLAACSGATPPPAPAAALPAPVPAAAVAARPAASRTLTGLSAGEVVALLGEPDFRRAEPPAELWQYRTADCVLDLFLYGDAAGAHVLHSETRDRFLLPAGSGRCATAGDLLALRTRQSRL